MWARLLVMIIAVAAAASGCGSTCGSGCPVIDFEIFATPGENLGIATAQLVGPGCPLMFRCGYDAAGANPCARISLLGSQAGLCELDVTFSDGRAPLMLKTEFAPETHQGCCHGFPVIGATSYTVPPLHPVPQVDAGNDGAGGAPDATGEDAADPAAGDAADNPGD